MSVGFVDEMLGLLFVVMIGKLWLLRTTFSSHFTAVTCTVCNFGVTGPEVCTVYCTGIDSNEVQSVEASRFSLERFEGFIQID